MADQIFPLSPIEARAALPSEEDYDAIREAFMETSRGRWFLNEYTKRNRNADTTLVLDAVARLESSIADHKQQQPPEPREDRSAELIAAVMALLGEGRTQADALLPTQQAPSEDSPAFKGVRVLREMAWALRESGNDGRIPDLLQKQASAIEEGLKATADQDARGKLLAIFDSLCRDVGQLAHFPVDTAPQVDATAEPVVPADALSELDDTLAVLSDEFGKDQPDELAWHEPAPEREPLAAVSEAAPPVQLAPASDPVVPQTIPPPTPLPALSLGAALLETGIVTKPDAPRGDPLAPFKRMTQSERIAFFS